MLLGRKNSSVSWIIVFLGNPGVRYENTRHNAGFMAADVIEKNAGTKINRLKFSSLTASANLGGQRVFFMKPQTYMNLSGSAVRQAMDFYKVPLERVLVVSDDVALPIGKLRIRRSGSAGGHNGLKDIIVKCGGDGFPRVKIGVGSPPHGDYEMADWVLSKFTGDDEKIVADAVKSAAGAVDAIIASGVEGAMSVYN